MPSPPPQRTQIPQTNKETKMYSINPVIHNYKDKKGLSKVSLQVIYNRMKVYAATTVKVEPAFFKDGAVIKLINKNNLNNSLLEQRVKIENRLLKELNRGVPLSKKHLALVVKGEKAKDTMEDFIYNLIETNKGKLSDGRLSHYGVIMRKIFEFDPLLKVSSVNLKWLNSFETWIRDRGLDNNTILSNMSLVLSILNRASELGLIDTAQYKGYKRPKYNQKLVEYLSQEDVDKIKTFVDAIAKPGHKIAGYYFLLSCYTGYRISDARRFNYETMVRDGQIVLRAGKNGKIVSIPVYPKLKEILDFVKDNPMKPADQKINEYLKEIAGFCGIKISLHFHISRHTFSMMLMSKGFSIDEVAQMLGDTPEIARVYAQISNSHLTTKIKEKLG